MEATEAKITQKVDRKVGKETQKGWEENRRCGNHFKGCEV